MKTRIIMFVIRILWRHFSDLIDAVLMEDGKHVHGNPIRKDKYPAAGE